jgi:hypothetical protein
MPQAESLPHFSNITGSKRFGYVAEFTKFIFLFEIG